MVTDEPLPTTLLEANVYLESLYFALDEARQSLIMATMQLTASQGVKIDERLYGALSETNPQVQVLKQAVIQAEERYRTVWDQLIPQAKAHLEQLKQQMEQLKQQTLLQEREALVKERHPDIVKRITELVKSLQELPSDSRQYYVTKHEFQQLHFRLQQLRKDAEKELV